MFISSGANGFGLNCNNGFFQMPSLQLYGYADSSHAYSTVCTSGSTTSYQVPVGRTLNIKAFMVYVRGTTSNTWRCDMGYNDNNISQNVNTAPTNFVSFVTGNAGIGEMLGSSTTFGLAIAIGGLDFNVPAGKYPIANQNGVGIGYCSFVLYGDLT